jgi:ABC-type sulfate transport system permease subunit
MLIMAMVAAVSGSAAGTAKGLELCVEELEEECDTMAGE